MDQFETSGEFFDGVTANSTQVPVVISGLGVSFELAGEWIEWPQGWISPKIQFTSSTCFKEI